MALNAFLRIVGKKGKTSTDIKGSCKEKGMEGWIQLIACDFGIDGSKWTCKVTKDTDQSTPQLYKLVSDQVEDEKFVVDCEIRFQETRQAQADRGPVNVEIPHFTSKFEACKVSPITTNMADVTEHANVARRVRDTFEFTFAAVENTWENGTSVKVGVGADA